MKRVFVRPLENSDLRKLESLRRAYKPADLEIPKGYRAPGVETIVAEKHKEELGERPDLLSSLTGTLAVVLDPLIRDPNAPPLDIQMGLVKQEATLTCWGMANGSVDAYIAVPVQLNDYIELLKKYGYKVTVENCVVMRRALKPDTVPLLGDERDEIVRVGKTLTFGKGIQEEGCVVTPPELVKAPSVPSHPLEP